MATSVNSTEAPLIVIVGPTASGKTAAALSIAARYGGEIICADSRTVYRGLDIGTAKPTAAERALVPHHLLDVVNPDQRYTAAQFQHDARIAIDDIRARGKVPIVVGGSGLYVDSLLFNYVFGSVPDPIRRSRLNDLSIEELHRYSNQHNITLPNNLYNKRYVIRAIEQSGINIQRSKEILQNTIVVGIATEDVSLKQRIFNRAQNIFKDGVVDEARRVADMFGWGCNALNAPAYQACRQYIENTVTFEAAIKQMSGADWQLARRQRTWFKRNKHITWLPREQVEPYVHSIFTH